MADIDEIKRRNKLEDVLPELGMPIETKSRGIYLKPPDGTKEGGLVINTKLQQYFWNSKSEGGDIFHYLQRHHGHTFQSALEFLANRAGITLTNDPEKIKRQLAQRKKYDALTVCMRYLVQKFEASAAAKAYATSRGWSEKTIKRMRLGFWDGDVRSLRGHLNLHEVDLTLDVVKAVLNIPKGMMVYGHWEGERCVYMSGRSIEGKRHYNLPGGLVGGKQFYWNPSAMRRKDILVICEGQADAISWEEWDVPSLALAGSNLGTSDDGVLERLKAAAAGTEHVVIALDQDESGIKNAAKVAEVFGPLTRIMLLEDYNEQEVKDANDLLKAGMPTDEVQEKLAQALIYPIFLCKVAGLTRGFEKEKREKAAMEAFLQLGKYKQAAYRKTAAKALDVTLTRFDNMVKALDETRKEEEKKRSVHKQMKYMAGGYMEDHLFEMVYDPDEQTTAFIVRDPEGKISRQDMLEFKHTDVYPFPPTYDLIYKEGVQLPSGVDDYGSMENLINTIRQFLYKYVDVPEEMERMAAYYAVLTWMADLFPVVPYLRGLGDYGSGKTRYVQITGLVSFRSMFTVGLSSTSSIFRTIDMFGMITLVLDEADFKNSDETSDVIGLINTGNRKGFPVWRVEKTADGNMAPKAYQSFGPKMFSQRKGFQDQATNSRCLTWEANGGIPRPEIPILLPNTCMEEARAIRNMMLDYRMKNWNQDIEIDYNGGDRRLPGRLREMMIPLLTIAPEMEKELNEFMREVAGQMSVDYQSSIEAKVLYAIIRNYYRPHGEAADFFQGQLALSMKNIAIEANRIIDIENAVSGEEEEEDRWSGKKKRLTAKGIGSVIRNKLNMRTERGNVGTRPACLVWDESRVGNLALRYGMDEEFQAIKAGKENYFDVKSNDKNSGKTNYGQKEESPPLYLDN